MSSGHGHRGILTRYRARKRQSAKGGGKLLKKRAAWFEYRDFVTNKATPTTVK